MSTGNPDAVAVLLKLTVFVGRQLMTDQGRP